MVVADIQLISDKDSIPHGYCYIAEHLEPSEYIHTHTHTSSLLHHYTNYFTKVCIKMFCLSKQASFQMI